MQRTCNLATPTFINEELMFSMSRLKKKPHIQGEMSLPTYGFCILYKYVALIKARW